MNPLRLALTTGEPAGIGPEICLKRALLPQPAALIGIGDADFLTQRADDMGIPVVIERVTSDTLPDEHTAGRLAVLHTPISAHDCLGVPDTRNAAGLIDGLNRAIDGCIAGDFAGMVTAPVQKSTIADGGFDFLGHTEYIEKRSGASQSVMLIANDTLRVALVTTHLPLRSVADAISEDKVVKVARVLAEDLSSRFGIDNPTIAVCGLNPHAGEQGHLGHEDEAIIKPAIAKLRSEDIAIHGPYPADTIFNHAGKDADAILAMYHDQGLPVVKFAGFGSLVNVTLGLPIIRTSVDHGSALDLAGKGVADTESLQAAIDLAARLAASEHAQTS
ncbi:MAG: 4-hydroxythreonine-4-phosphate dehydrogenase PdxA [Pseudomonadota bacterium]